MNGAKIILESLKKEKVTKIFGIGGGSVIPLFDELYKEKDIEFILTRHEQAAAHMADGLSRATGEVGVCVATSGPGATNLVTGLATAHMDSIPIVAFTGQVATHLVGNDAFQEADTTGITRPVTKHNYLVTDVKDLASTIKEAFYLARSGRPGPVLIDLPVDVQRNSCRFKYPEKVNIRGYKPKTGGHARQIKAAAKLINSSNRPVVYAGGGVIISKASKELRSFAAKGKLPLTTTLMGTGAFPADSELSLSMLGMHGTYYANHAIQQSDLIVAVGVRFDDRITGRVKDFARGAKVIHIDIDPTSISKNVKADIPIVGDCKNILAKLIKEIELKERPDWHKKIAGWKKKHPLSYKKDKKLRPQYVIEQIYEATSGKAIIATEVGQHQMWAEQFYKYNEPNTFITSGGLGTMGFGFPAAIGAKLGKPKKTVINIAGDGSFQMNIQELATCVVNDINVINVILNNNYLGMVRQWQELFYDRRYSQVCLGKSHKERVPDFAKVAEAYGARGITITSKKEVIPAIKEALKHKGGPVVMDFIIEEEENVYPMVPAGAAIDEILIDMA
ncbi:MAG: biosynthetic-type acetolactate synthase large subunit [Elusimicrobiota bacterium]|nr:biosynthetic-type acetolactate synthase large subunit [Elusimicrobiota bacterium]